MANSSILAAFERMWQHTILKLDDNLSSSKNYTDEKLLNLTTKPSTTTLSGVDLNNYKEPGFYNGAVSGSYTDLNDKPTIGNGTIVIKQNGTQKGSFAMNQTGDTTIELSDNDTNTKVTNTLATTTKAYVTGTTSSTTNTGTQVFDTGVYLDATAGQLVANTFKGNLSGNADTASKLGSKTIGGTAKPIYLKGGVPTECSSLVGSKIQPIYMDEGTLVRCDYTIEKSVPSDAVFTDTTYSTATSSEAGLMSAQDKAFLDFIKQFFVESNPNQIIIGNATLVYDSENGLKVVF